MTEPTSAQTSFASMRPAQQVVEIFYQRALEITKAAYQSINRAYPVAVRRESPKMDGRYAEALRQAKQHLNFHKRLVADFVPNICLVKRHPFPYDFSQDLPTKQLRGFMEVQLTLLYQKLVDYADVLLPEADDIESYLKSLEKVLATELKTMLTQPSPFGITNYEITPILKAEDYEETYGVQYTVDTKTKKKLSERVEK